MPSTTFTSLTPKQHLMNMLDELNQAEVVLFWDTEKNPVSDELECALWHVRVDIKETLKILTEERE